MPLRIKMKHTKGHHMPQPLAAVRSHRQVRCTLSCMWAMILQSCRSGICRILLVCSSERCAPQRGWGVIGIPDPPDSHLGVLTACWESPVTIL